MYSEGTCEQKLIKNLGENGAWAYTGTAEIFWVPPIISGTGKATNFKLGRYIQRVYPNKSPLKIWENRERGRTQFEPIQPKPNSPNFWSTPYYLRNGHSYERQIWQEYSQVHPNKSPLKFWEKMERGRIQILSKFFEYPLLSQERVKLRTSNLAGIFTGSIQTKAL